MDVNPGDRAETCGGMMEPVGVEGTQDVRRIVHHCTLCGMVRIVRSAPNDDTKALFALMRSHADSVARGKKI